MCKHQLELWDHCICRWLSYGEVIFIRMSISCLEYFACSAFAASKLFCIISCSFYHNFLCFLFLCTAAQETWLGNVNNTKWIRFILWAKISRCQNPRGIWAVNLGHVCSISDNLFYILLFNTSSIIMNNLTFKSPSKIISVVSEFDTYFDPLINLYRWSSFGCRNEKTYI